jgi:hypothetical protein
MKLIKQVISVLITETGWLLALRKQAGCLGRIVTGLWAGQLEEFSSIPGGSMKVPFSAKYSDR